jgi:hypothetical protein
MLAITKKGKKAGNMISAFTTCVHRVTLAVDRTFDKIGWKRKKKENGTHAQAVA